MTKIIVKIAKPEGKITESSAYNALRGLPMGYEAAIIPTDASFSTVEIKGKTYDKAFDSFSKFVELYVGEVFNVTTETNKKTKVLFNK